MDQEYAAAAVAELAGLLEGCGSLWVVGGSTGLMMRGAALGRSPRDVDIYADEEDAAALHARLAAYAIDTPTASRTERYRSILSHYAVGETVVELVGAFRIETEGSLYRTEVRRHLHPAGDICDVAGVGVKLVPLAHELIFNVLRHRGDRCELAGGLIRERPGRHLPVLKALIESNALSQEHLDRVRGYAGVSVKAGWE